jgi:hypothetical protein
VSFLVERRTTVGNSSTVTEEDFKKFESTLFENLGKWSWQKDFKGLVLQSPLYSTNEPLSLSLYE